MPYKDPERNRQWEREHREQRSVARRTARHVNVSGKQLLHPKLSPVPIRKPEPQSGWGILGLLVGVALIVVGTFAGISVPGNSHMTGKAEL